MGAGQEQWLTARQQLLPGRPVALVHGAAQAAMTFVRRGRLQRSRYQTKSSGCNQPGDRMSGLRFEGQAVFVAGGTSGINLAIAEAFAAGGANVAVMSRSPEKVDSAAASLRRHGTTI